MNQLVSIVIPTFQGRQLLEKHLPSVLAAMRQGDELIISEDAGNDDTFDWLHRQWSLQPVAKHSVPDADVFMTNVHQGSRAVVVWFIRQHQNIRFGANCNQAVAFAHHPYVLLLNNDVSPHADVIEKLLPFFVDESVFAVGCMEHEPNDQGGVTLGGKNQLRFQRGMFMHSRAEQMTTGETAWASGGSALFDRGKWLALSGFDKRFYPAYWEDIDLSYRAKKFGWKVLFAENAIVEHRHETTNTKELGVEQLNRWSWRNGRVFTLIHANIWQKMQFLFWLPYHLWKMRAIGF